MKKGDMRSSIRSARTKNSPNYNNNDSYNNSSRNRSVSPNRYNKNNSEYNDRDTKKSDYDNYSRDNFKYNGHHRNDSPSRSKYNEDKKNDAYVFSYRSNSPSRSNNYRNEDKEKNNNWDNEKNDSRDYTNNDKLFDRKNISNYNDKNYRENNKEKYNLHKKRPLSQSDSSVRPSNNGREVFNTSKDESHAKSGSTSHASPSREKKQKYTREKEKSPSTRNYDKSSSKKSIKRKDKDFNEKQKLENESPLYNKKSHTKTDSKNHEESKRHLSDKKLLSKSTDHSSSKRKENKNSNSDKHGIQDIIENVIIHEKKSDHPQKLENEKNLQRSNQTNDNTIIEEISPTIVLEPPKVFIQCFSCKNNTTTNLGKFTGYKKRCDECHKKHSQIKRSRIKKNECVVCGLNNKKTTIKEGTHTCDSCVENDKETKIELKSRGKCLTLGCEIDRNDDPTKFLFDKVYCERCVENNRIRKREKNLQKVLSGVCPKCGINSFYQPHMFETGKEFCLKCSKEKDERDFIKRNKYENLCSGCGKTKVGNPNEFKGDKNVCVTCTEKHISQKTKKKMEGICCSCGIKKTQENLPKFSGDKSSCDDCIDKKKNKSKIEYEKKITQKLQRQISGNCTSCNKSKTENPNDFRNMNKNCNTCVEKKVNKKEQRIEANQCAKCCKDKNTSPSCFSNIRDINCDKCSQKKKEKKLVKIDHGECPSCKNNRLVFKDKFFDDKRHCNECRENKHLEKQMREILDQCLKCGLDKKEHPIKFLMDDHKKF
eukprot:TRINITY_DN1975_c0_g1_i1.p1 TRINITY_DN1975_c0_g1~~TRINITY_DN1975_c0_g1_i1.p1  ORF type:complete len:877 (-),score=237.39 TRINITY_DN1975_c0_g1_i1:494-2791(-)